MNENEIRGIVIDCAVKVHMRLGQGLRENAYEILSYDSGEALIEGSISRIIGVKPE